MENKEEKDLEETMTSTTTASSEQPLDNGIIKTAIEKKDLDEGFTNIAVAIDEYYGMTEDPLSQYQREVNNAKDASTALAAHNLKMALSMNESCLVERFLKEDRSLREVAGTLEAVKIVDKHLTEDMSSHLAGKLFTEMVYQGALEADKTQFIKIKEAVERVGVQNFSVTSILENLLENGDL